MLPNFNLPKISHQNIFKEKRSFDSSAKFNFKNQEYFVSSFNLGLKICFSFLAIISLVKLGFSSKVRLIRLAEIQDSFLYEKSRFEALSSRFDDLFSFEGEQRFMKDQDQMISRDIIRVIWR